MFLDEVMDVWRRWSRGNLNKCEEAMMQRLELWQNNNAKKTRLTVALPPRLRLRVDSQKRIPLGFITRPGIHFKRKLS